MKWFAHGVFSLGLLSWPGGAQTWVISPVNGHSYTTLSPRDWRAAEAEAVRLGGHLATIRSAAEENWIRQTFGGRHLWIGFTDEGHEGQWVWVSGEPVSYANWAPGEPNNVGGEHWANVLAQGRWNDSPLSIQLEALVELPGGTYTTFGSGCPGRAGTPTISPILPPRIGRPFSILLSNIPPDGGLIFPLGISRTNWNIFPLPLSLAPLGMPGCSLLTDGAVGPQPLLPTPWGAEVWGRVIPNNTALIGVQFFQQAFYVDPTANAVGMIVSNGGHGVIGN